MGRAIRNIIRGFGTVGGILPISRKLPEISSRRMTVEDALHGDWERVGGDIVTAMNQFEKEHGKKQTVK